MHIIQIPRFRKIMKKYKGKEGFDEIKEDYQNLKTIRE